MRGRRILISILLMVCLLLILGFPALAGSVQIGGELQTGVVALFDEAGGINAGLQSHLNLKFILPEQAGTSARCEVDVDYRQENLTEQTALNIDINKLYLQQEFTDWDLTLGRQPVSWSFGSIINPVDFTTGLDVSRLQGTEKTGIDSVSAYIPLGWASNINLVAAFTEENKKSKWGIRGRTLWHDFDMQASYVQESPDSPFYSLWPRRIGIAAKGDLGPLGIYGAAAYHFRDSLEEGEKVLLLGFDYSFYLESYMKVGLQLEYLRDDAGVIKPPMTGRDLVLAYLNYEIDEFSSIGLMAVNNPADASWLLGPYYSNQISSTLDLNIGAVILAGEPGSFFGPMFYPGAGAPVRGMLYIGFSYPF